MKGVKKILNGVVVISLLLSLGGCSKEDEVKQEVSSNSSTNKLEQIKESGKLVVGTSGEYPPYEFHKMVDGEDTIVGLDIMLAEKIAEEIGVEVELKDMEFDSLIGALNAEKIDIVLAGMTPTKEREKSVDFSKVYYVEDNDLIVREGDEDKFKTEEDLKKHEIGVLKGSIQETYVTKEVVCPNAKSLGKTGDLILDLQNENIDAVLVSSNVARINTGRFDGISIANSPIGDDITEGAAVAFKKSEDNDELVEVVNKVLEELIETGEMEDMVDESIKLAQEQIQEFK